MDPFHPAPRLLRKIASFLRDCADERVRVWAEAVGSTPRAEPTREFAGVSVVKTYRKGVFCGYEVWRHLENAKADPTRQKARLWFGRRRHGATGALDLARKSAAMLEAMSKTELHEWWAEYRAARDARRSVENLWRDETRFEDGYDYSDLKSMSHVFTRAS